MKVGNLRLDQKYRYISLEACDEASAACDNCGAIIKNIYTIEGDSDKRRYFVGSECVAAYTALNPLEAMEMKRKFSRQLRFTRELRKSALILIDKDNNSFYFYKAPNNIDSEYWLSLNNGKWSHNYRGRGYYDKYKAVIDKCLAIKINQTEVLK